MELYQALITLDGYRLFSKNTYLIACHRYIYYIALTGAQLLASF